MFVNNLLFHKRDLTLVTPEDTIKKALDVINEKNFLSVPVADKNKFYGMISKAMIYTFYYEKSVDKQFLLSDFKVQDIMRKDVPEIDPLEQAEEAAHFLEIYNVPFVAVVDKYGDFKGIVTHHAIFHQFTELFGINKGKRLSVIAYDIPGQVSKLSRIVAENDGDIISFVVIDPRTVTDVREIVMRIRTDNFDNIVQKVKEAGFNIQ